MFELKDSDPAILLQGHSKKTVDTFTKIESDLANIAKRIDEMDAALADLKNSNMFADLEKMAANNRKTVDYWAKHNERLSGK
jgi:hypothetical protein